MYGQLIGDADPLQNLAKTCLTDFMATPTLHVHLIDDPAQPPVLGGDRGIVVSEKCRSTQHGIPIEFRLRNTFRTVVADLPERLLTVAATFPKKSTSEEWDVLDILMFQSSPNNLDVQNSRGVMGRYVNGISDPPTIAPVMELYLSPGHESRVIATAIHELGHFLRARAVWDSGKKPFIYRAFEEGLCENLVERELGKEHVLHSASLSYQELIDSKNQLLVSVKAIQDSQAHADFTLAGYRLGYHVVRNLIADGYELESLFSLPFSETQTTVLKGCQSLLDRLATA